MTNENTTTDVKTIKEHLRDATEIAMDKREMEMHCGNALAEILRLEEKLLLAQKALKRMPRICNTMYRGNDNKSIGQYMRDVLLKIKL